MAGPVPQQFVSPASASTISAAQPLPPNSTLPRPWEMVMHPVKMIRFVNALWRDPRISWVRKLLYLVPLLVLLVAVLLPEGIIATVLAGLVPILGPLLNVPADAAIDWVVLGLAAYALLGIFPKQIVRGLHAQFFHPTR
ncbi:MAG TPA: hypothetical protein VFN11_22470 [Ktedonobacterales bacterium]|nr:hypothetical protein [Ktedonobacterales bacterium]